MKSDPARVYDPDVAEDRDNSKATGFVILTGLLAALLLIAAGIGAYKFLFG